MPQRVLVIQNETDDPVHLMGSWMDGVEIESCRAFDGDAVPTSLEGYAALVVMGGAMGAGDDATVPWLAPTKALIRRAASDRVPTLGICLGHQLAAVALGGEVRPSPKGRQFGMYAVGWTPAAAVDPLFAPVAGPRRALQWNDDVVTRLPEGAELMATAPGGEVQAARFAETVWGVQWHPEADEPLVRIWASGDHSVEPERVAAQLEELRQSGQELDQAWRPLAVRFAELAVSRPLHR